MLDAVHIKKIEELVSKKPRTVQEIALFLKRIGEPQTGMWII